MTRKCGACNLCCKLEKIQDFKKKNVWCQHCDIGVGCKIYPNRPEACVKFECLWLKDESLPDSMRPDLVHMYVVKGADYYKVCVDPSFPEWNKQGSALIDIVLERGHAFIETGNQINFLKGKHLVAPERILLDWTL